VLEREAWNLCERFPGVAPFPNLPKADSGLEDHRANPKEALEIKINYNHYFN